MTKHDFWSMGGFAVYVWSSYAAGLLVLTWNLWSPRLRRGQVLRELLDGDAAESDA